MIPEILSERRGTALVLTFNRPDHGNALSHDMAVQLFQQLKLATTDRTVRAILLRGAGAHFMDGLEMGMFGGNIEAGIERNNQMLQPYHSAIRELRVMDKPVLASVHGRVAGPGLSLMLAADLVLAAKGAVFNGGFTTHGMTPDGGASFYLTRKVGAAKATEILMLSEDFDSVVAERLNLVNGIADDDKLEADALNWVDRLAQGPTRAFAGVKQLVNKAFEQDLNAHLGLEHTQWGASVRSFDFREAVKAHAAKRPPKFSGV